MKRFFTLALCAGLAAACQATSDNNHDNSPDPGTQSDSGTGTDSSESDTGFGDAAVAYEGCDSMNFLFIIDNSGSMTEEQDNLAANFPKMIQVIEDYRTPAGEKVDYRVAVTTSSVNRTFKMMQPPLLPLPGSPWVSSPGRTSGENGVLQGMGKCGLQAPWIEGPGANVAPEFSCMAKVGAEGTSPEMPFAALELALGEQSAPGKPNAGFYSKDENSLLVVVIITDEDDCSIDKGGTMWASDPEIETRDCDEKKSVGLYTATDMKTYLDTLTGEEGRYVVVGIGGPSRCLSKPGNACSSPTGTAIWAARVEELTALIGDYGMFGDISTGDLWTSLEKALSLIKLTCDSFPIV